MNDASSLLIGRQSAMERVYSIFESDRFLQKNYWARKSTNHDRWVALNRTVFSLCAPSSALDEQRRVARALYDEVESKSGESK